MLTRSASRRRELTGAGSSPEHGGVPVAECCVDPLFGAPSLLHEGARRFASDEADAQVWWRWAAEPEAQKRDVETLVGFYNVALRATVRPRIEELLLPKAGTDWSGYAHVRELVRQIYFEFDRADCWAWWAPSRGTRPGPQLSRCQLSAASTPATPRAPGRDDSAPGSAERATADTLDYVSERMMREGVLQAAPRRFCIACRRTMHHMDEPTDGPPPMPALLPGPITATTAPVAPADVAPLPAAEVRMRHPGWVLWYLLKPCGHLMCTWCFFRHVTTSRSAITEPVVCPECRTEVTGVRRQQWYGQLSQQNGP